MDAHTLSFRRLRKNQTGAESTAATIRDLVIAGWTGRNREALEKHIQELEVLGVTRPASTPCFYRVGASLLTTADVIQVVGEDTSGEVEFVLFSLPDGLWVGVGSDHTDRKVEQYSVTISKQVCPKPVACALWPYAEVARHWDDLMLRSYIVSGSRRVLYQEGSVRAMRAPEELIHLYLGRQGSLAKETALFGGTLAALDSLRRADRFELELEDPVLKRKISHGYQIRSLPLAGADNG